MEYSEYDRMTLSELLASPWLQQEVDVDNYNWNAIVPDNGFTTSSLPLLTFCITNIYSK